MKHASSVTRKKVYTHPKVHRPRADIQVNEKGIPVEKRGRKTTDLRAQAYGSGVAGKVRITPATRTKGDVYVYCRTCETGCHATA
jgi:hypothetical protein